MGRGGPSMPPPMNTGRSGFGDGGRGGYGGRSSGFSGGRGGPGECAHAASHRAVASSTDPDRLDTGITSLKCS